MRMIKDSQDTHLQVIATNMHLSPKYGNTYQEIEKDGFTIDCKIPIIDENAEDNAVTTVKSMATALSGFAEQKCEARRLTHTEIQYRRH